MTTSTQAKRRARISLVAALGMPMVALAIVSVASFGARAGDAPASDDGVKAFVDVAKVLQSPRCVNCHPAGNAPLVGDDQREHPMEVRRGLERVGMSCQTCHRATPTLASRAVGAPPAVAGWALPPEQTPMVFQGRSLHDLCAQLKDPAQNGGKDAGALAHHVAMDPIVLYGFDPGGNRTLPPLKHDAFVARFTAWQNAGMPCPEAVAR